MDQSSFSFKSFFVPFSTIKAIHWLIFIGIIVYFNSLFNGFVWDDIGQIVNNDSVHSLTNITSFFFGGQDINGNIVKIHAAFYRPLMEAFFTIIYSFAGQNAFFFHFFSLIMQITIAVFVYFLFRRFFSLTVSFLLTVILIIHPLNTEAVDYISAYNDLMYLFFGMISIMVLPRGNISMKRLFILVICLFLSLLSKETGFLFITVLISYSYLYYKKNTLRVVIASVIVVICYMLLRTSLYIGLSEEQAFAFSPFLHMSFMLHLVNIPALFTYYLHNFIYPDQLAIAQQWSVETINTSDFYFPLAVFISFLTINLFLFIQAFRKKDKEQVRNIIFFSLWFWFGISLYFQWIPLDMTVADRWFYFPMIGLLGLIGLLFQQFKIKKSYKPIFISLMVIYLTFLVITTIVRNMDWNNERSLYFHDITVTENSFDLENLVGMIDFKDHNLPAAKQHFQKSISLYRCSDAVNNLGYFYQINGQVQKAEHEYFIAVKCSQGYKDYGNLVILLYKEHKFDLAEQYTKLAIQKYPNGAGLYFILGLIDNKKGNKYEALKNLTIGYKLSQDPQIAKAYLLIQQNKPVNLSF